MTSINSSKELLNADCGVSEELKMSGDVAEGVEPWAVEMADAGAVEANRMEAPFRVRFLIREVCMGIRSLEFVRVVLKSKGLLLMEEV